MGKVIVMFLILTTSCCLGKIGESSTIKIMSWNVQNLFDGEDSGLEYYDYSVEEGKWSEELYQIRLDSISSIIMKNSPDIIALQEIEGEQVLADLESKLNRYSYFVSTEDESVIQCGLLSVYPIISVGFLSSGKYNFDRSILEVELDIDGESLYVLNSHWKSKSGDFSEHIRLESAKLIKKRLEELTGKYVVVLGDLNENYNESSLVSYSTALSFNKTGDGLYITDRRSMKEGDLYTPWPESGEEGSYLYGDRWESIDHIMFSAELMDSSGISYKSFSVDKREELFTYNGKIRRWITDYRSGYSDHLPIIAELQRYEVVTSLE